MSNQKDDENLLVEESFAALLAESFSESTSVEGSVVKGKIIAIEAEYAIIDVGLKSEGRIPLKEFTAPGQDPELQGGDNVEVYVERMEDKDGQALLSREKARREEAWVILESAFEAQYYLKFFSFVEKYHNKILQKYDQLLLLLHEVLRKILFYYSHQLLNLQQVICENYFQNHPQFVHFFQNLLLFFERTA